MKVEKYSLDSICSQNSRQIWLRVQLVTFNYEGGTKQDVQSDHLALLHREKFDVNVSHSGVDDCAV